MKKKWTGERLETFIYTRDAIEHLHRYALVQEYITNKKVLDIACGEGYGTNLMAKDATFVYGVDIDAETVTAAQKKYTGSNLSYLVGQADKIPLEDASVDVVVSFETIEHHDKHTEMMLEIKRVLKKEGIVIISTPDKKYYTDMRNFHNSFHIKELYKDEFAALLSAHFAKTQMLTQQHISGISLIQDENESNATRIYTGNYEAFDKIAVHPLYLVAIASDGDFTRQKTSVYDGYTFHLNQIVAQVRSSASYKIGETLLGPLKWAKKRFK